MRKANMPIHKTAELNSALDKNLIAIKTLKKLSFLSVFLCSSCLMTRREGEGLRLRIEQMEGEMAKLQRVRHDLDILLSGKVVDIYERMARLENVLSTVQESLFSGSEDNQKLLNEIHSLKNQLEEGRKRYGDLQKDQETLAEAQAKLSAEKNKIAIPALKNDHFGLAKKLYLADRLDDASYLFEEFNKLYKNDKDLYSQSSYLLGEIYDKKSALYEDEQQKIHFKKKAVISLQKVIEITQNKSIKEESLFKLSLLLAHLGNKEGAKAALKGLLQENPKSKRASDAKKHLVSLEE